MRGARRRSSCRIPVSAATRPGSAVPGSTSVSNVSDDLERPHPHRTDLADAAVLRGQPGRLQVEDDELRVLQRHVRVRIVREPDPRPDEGEPRVAVDDVVEERAGERDRGPLEREQHASGLLRRDRAVFACTSSTSRSAASNESCIARA